MKGKYVPPFVLHQERLVSFVPPGPENPFSSMMKRTSPRREKTADWIADKDLRSKVIGMLNGALKEHCYHLGILTPKKDRSQFYCPVFKAGGAREFVWDKGGRARTLAKLKSRRDGTSFGVHMSAQMRFIWLGARLYLLVEPGWLFTTDGITPLAGPEVGVFSTKWGGRERNATVLRNVLMWGMLISEGAREAKLRLGTEYMSLFVIVQSVPAHTKINQGLAGDVIRLDRILGGEGAGEKAANEGVNDATELDEVADFALVGARNGKHRVDDEGANDDDDDDTGPDKAVATAAEGNELELPLF